MRKMIRNDSRQRRTNRLGHPAAPYALVTIALANAVCAGIEFSRDGLLAWICVIIAAICLIETNVSIAIIRRERANRHVSVTTHEWRGE